MKRYIVADIGCLECGNQTDIIGVFKTQTDAEATGAVARTSLSNDGEWPSGSFGSDWHGESMIVWFEIEVT